MLTVNTSAQPSPENKNHANQHTKHPPIATSNQNDSRSAAKTANQHTKHPPTATDDKYEQPQPHRIMGDT